MHWGSGQNFIKFEHKKMFKMWTSVYLCPITDSMASAILIFLQLVSAEQHSPTVPLCALSFENNITNFFKP
jgi:hypothetical protein